MSISWQPLARIAVLCLVAVAAGAEPDYAAQRRAMVAEIAADVRATRAYIDRDRLDPAVMAAMEAVPRHRFVPDARRDEAYANRPLPIGYGQTISQPYIVALMTDLLDLQPGHRVLEIGTGSGYQAAVAAQLAGDVFSIEIVEPLGVQAARRLRSLGYDNVRTRIGDGYYGWPEQAPFDAIIVTAAADHVPPPLLRQLDAGGRMVIPVGSRFLTQQLVLIEKDAHGETTTRPLLPVMFVPLTGER